MKESVAAKSKAANMKVWRIEMAKKWRSENDGVIAKKASAKKLAAENAARRNGEIKRRRRNINQRRGENIK